MAKFETGRERLDLRQTTPVKRMFESRLDRAEEILPDRRRFELGLLQWEAFQQALDAPPTPAPRLAELLKEASVFERGGLE